MAQYDREAVVELGPRGLRVDRYESHRPSYAAVKRVFGEGEADRLRNGIGPSTYRRMLIVPGDSPAGEG